MRVIRKRWKAVLGIFGAATIAVYLINASWLASPQGKRWWLAHRGVHQTFSPKGLTAHGCSAERINRPTHQILENTVESIRAAFEAGAAIVEIDVHPTTDGRFAVFHDWTVDCRTDGTGTTREQTLAYLQSLDIGHGYTADDGKTFPLRGLFVGKMPSLREVLRTFPERRFLINIKSNDPQEGVRLAAALDDLPPDRIEQLAVYGGHLPVARVLEAHAALRGFSRQTLKTCIVRYAALGWSGFVPAACRQTIILVPLNVAPWLWGWPHRLLARMRAVGTDVVLVGPVASGGAHTTGIDDHATLAEIPDGFTGGIWTNRIELMVGEDAGPQIVL